MNTNEIKQKLTELRMGNVTDTETAVSNAITLYKVTAAKISLLKEMQADIKLLLSDIMAETGQIEWNTEAGRTYVPKPSISVRYDAKKLDTFCEADPDLAAKLAPFRKETQRAGSLTIR